MAPIEISEDENAALATRFTDELNVDEPRYQTEGKPSQYFQNGQKMLHSTVKDKFTRKL